MELPQCDQTPQTNDLQHTGNHSIDSGNVGQMSPLHPVQLTVLQSVQHDDKWIDTFGERHRQGLMTRYQAKNRIDTGMVNVLKGGSLASNSSIHCSKIVILSSGNLVFSTFLDLFIMYQRESRTHSSWGEWL